MKAKNYGHTLSAILVLTAWLWSAAGARAATVLQFDDSSVGVTLTDSIVCDADFTVEYWVRSTNSSVYAVAHSSEGDDYALRHDPYRWIRRTNPADDTVGQHSGLLFRDPVVTFYLPENFESDVWTHFAFTREDGTLSFYRNGVFIHSRAWAGQLRLDRIGSAAFIGRAADLRVWDHARSAEAIEFNRHRRLSGGEAGLLGYWPLDEGSGTTVLDLSPEANHGTLDGAAWTTDDALVLVADDSPFVPAAPLALADAQTASEEFTNDATVDVAAFPVPPNVDQFQITHAPDPASLSADPNAWTNTASLPAQLSFPPPGEDGEVLLYAWFTNSVTDVTLRRATGRIVHTQAAPTPQARATLARETAGFTVRVLPAELDAGSTGGMVGDRPIPVHRLEIVDLNSPTVDLTPADPFLTLPATAGDYDLALRVINAAGNETVSALCVLTLAETTALPDGNRFVAIGNQNAASPYDAWETAAADIQTAVTAAAAGDVVRVARGVYHGTGNPVVDINKPLHLIGAHPREQVVIDAGGGDFGNRRGILVVLPTPAPGDPAPDLRFENLTITGGFEQSRYGSSGRGMRLDHSNVTNGIAVIRNCVFTDNLALKADSAGARAQGSGLYAVGAVGTAFHLSLSDTDFLNNRSRGRDANGIGLYVLRGRLTIDRCRIIGNEGWGLVQQESWGRDANGGGAFISTVAPDSWIRDSVLDNNVAVGSGGGSFGGALNVSGGPVTLDRSVFRGNLGTYIGGVIVRSIDNQTNLVRNCLFVGNRATAYGGGLAAWQAAHILLESSTITGNHSPASSGGGGGVFVAGAHWSGSPGAGYMLIRNSIVRGNTVNNANNWGGRKDFEYTCTSPITDGTGSYFLIGNINVDPDFVAPGSGDYRLTRFSPCRDVGSNQPWMTTARDLAGFPRLDMGAGIVDLGAYEYQLPGTLMIIR